MAETWLSIKVDLVSGRGGPLWPRPGRVFAAASSHTFEQLATAIDTGFARWDLAHLHTYDLSADRLIVSRYDDDPPEHAEDSNRVKWSRLKPGERFAYTFDLGDNWTHLCTVDDHRIDPHEIIGLVPKHPVPYFGWGSIPDQYGRRVEHDDGSGRALPPDPGFEDLPPLLSSRRPRGARPTIGD
jgi:hypothetical protein